MQQISKTGIEGVGYLHKPENDLRLKKVKLLVRILLAVSSIAAIAMAVILISSSK